MYENFQPICILDISDVASPEKVEEKSEGEEDWSEDSFAKIQEELIKRSHSTEQEETKEGGWLRLVTDYGAIFLDSPEINP